MRKKTPPLNEGQRSILDLAKKLSKNYAVHTTNLPTVAIYDRMDLRDDKGRLVSVNDMHKCSDMPDSIHLAQGDDASELLDMEHPSFISRDQNILIYLNSAGVVGFYL